MSTRNKIVAGRNRGGVFGALRVARAAGTAGTFRLPGRPIGLWALSLLATSQAMAQVAGEQVVHGSALFSRNGSVTTITAGRNAIINYSSFNIRAGETVQFVQPDALSRVLNRINSSAPSRIDGNLLANGRVYIVNPAGVIFGKGSLVNVGGIYAAAGTIANHDFVKGVDRFINNPNASVVNEGTIQANLVALIGKQVFNFGTIEAPQGTVAMLSGDTVLVGEQDGRVFAKFDTAAADVMGPTLPGQQLTAPVERRIGAGDVYGLAVWNKGLIKATNARIEAARGQTKVEGVIDASDRSAGGHGGDVRILGEAVAVVNAKIDVSGDFGGGTILIGGEYQGRGVERNATHTRVLGATDLKADAITEGDGGKIILWADNSTRASGTLSARGGELGGDGGFAEISGKSSLASDMRVDMSAPHGNMGTVLYDPADIIINGGSADGDDSPDNSATNLDDSGTGQVDFNDTPGTFNIFESEIEGTNANIILQATDTITTTGDFGGDAITIANNRNLSLETRNDNSDNAGGIDLTGSTDGTNLTLVTQGTGTITITSSAGGDLAGNIAIGGLTTGGGNVTVTTGNGTISIGNSINAGTGTVRLQSTDGITQSAGGITAGSLGARTSAGAIGLGGTNDADTVAVSVGGAGNALQYSDSDGFNIGTVSASGGFTATTGLIASGTSTVTLTAGGSGAVTQSSGANITGQTLNLLGTANYTLNEATNAVAALAATVTGNVAYTDAGGLTLGASTVSGNLSVATVNAGAAIDNGGNAVQVGGTLTIEADDINLTGAGVVTGGVGTGALVLRPLSDALNVAIGDGTNAPGDLVIDATDLAALGAFDAGMTFGRATGTGVMTIGNASFASSATFLMGGAGGAIQTDNNAALAVTGGTNDITISAGTGDLGAFVQGTGSTITAAGDVSITADAISLNGSANSISSTATGAALLQPASPDRPVVLADVGAGTDFALSTAELDTLANGFSTVSLGRLDGSGGGGATTQFVGAYTFRDPVRVRSSVGAGAMSIAGIITAPNEGAITGILLNSGGSLAVNAALISSGSDITLRSVGAMALGADVTATGADVRLIAGAGITQSAGGITGSTLGVRAGTASAGDVSLLSGTNDVATFAAVNSGAGSAIAYRDATGVTVDTAAAQDSLFTLATGVTATNGSLLIRAGGAVDFAQTVSIGSGTVRVNSAGAVTQSNGSLFATALGVIASGDVTFNQSNNQVATVAINNNGAGNVVQYSAFNGLAIGSVASLGGDFGGASGITTTTNGDVYVSAGAGGMGVTQAINAGTGTVRLLSATSSVSQSGSGVITAGTLGVRAVSGVSLGLTNTVSSFAASSSGAGQTIVMSSGSAMSTASVTGLLAFNATTGVTATDGDVTLGAGGAMSIAQAVAAGTGNVRLFTTGAGDMTQSAAITGAALGARTSSGNITLTNTSNNITTLAMSAGGAASTASYRDAGAMTVGSLGASGGFSATNGVSAGGDVLLHSGALMTLSNTVASTGPATVRLVSSAGINQTAGAISGLALGVNAAGDVTLNSATNNVGTLAASNTSSTSRVEYTDADAVALGTVAASGTFGATSGISTINGDVLVDTTAGTLAVDQAIAAGSGVVRLAGGSVTQTAAIAGGSLGVRSSGSVTLDLATNNVGTFAGTSSNSGSAIVYQDADAVTVGAVTASGGGTFNSLSGVSTTDGDVLLQSGGLATLGANIGAGTGTVRISAVGVSQTAGAVTASALGIASTGAVDVTQAGNNVATFAAGGTSIQYLDSDALAIGSVAASNVGAASFAGATGASTGTGDIFLSSTAGALTLNDAVAAGTGAVRLAGGAITQGVSGSVTGAALAVRSSGAVTLTNATNVVSTFAANLSNASSVVAFTNNGSLSLGAVNALGSLFAATSGVTTNNGDANIAALGALVVDNAIAAGSGTVRIGANSGTITQNAGIVAGTLGAIASGDIVLTNSANDVTDFAARNFTGGGAISYRDANGFTVSSVTAAGILPAFSGVDTNGGAFDISLQSGGAMVLAQNVTTNAANSVRLTSAAGISQSGGVITGLALGVNAAGDVTLNGANDVDTFAAANTGTGNVVEFTDADGFALGVVAASGAFGGATGVTTVDGNALLDAGTGAVAVDQAITAGTGAVRMVATTGITQTAAITAGSVGARTSAGNITLTNAGNAVGTFAANAGGAGSAVSYVDSDAISIGSVSANGTFTLTDGVTTGGGDLTLQSGAAMTLSTNTGSLGAGTGTIRLISGGGVNQSAGTTVTAAALGVQAAGTVTMLQAGNDVDTFAASNSGAATAVLFTDADDLTIGTVAAAGAFNATSGVTSSGGTIQVTAAGAMTVSQAVSATTNGDVLLTAGGNLAMGANVNAGTEDLILQAGSVSGGSSLFWSSAGLEVRGDRVTFRAGNGTGVPTSSVVNALGDGLTTFAPTLRGGAGGVTSPTSFTFRQDGPIDETNVPNNGQFVNGTTGIDYVLQSDDSSVTINDGTKFTNTNLTLSAQGAVNINSALNTNSLTIAGQSLVFIGAAFTGDLNATGGDIVFGNDASINNANITATGGTVTFGGTLTLTSGTVAITADEIDFNGNVAGPGALSIRPSAAGGNILIGAASNNPSDGILDLTSAEIDFLQATLASITIGRSDGTGLMTFASPTTFRSDASFLAGSIAMNAGVTTLGRDLSFGAPVTLGANVVIDTTSGGNAAGGDVAFTGAIESDSTARSLQINGGTGGTVTLGATGQANALSSVTVTGNTIALPSVRTVNAQSYTAAGGLNLVGSTVTLQTSGAAATDDVTILGNVNGAAAFAINVGSGDFNLGSSIGAITAVTSFSVTGNTNFLSPTSSVTTAGGAGNNVTFGGTVDGATDLLIAAGAGNVSFAGAVGSNTALTSVAVTGGAVTLSSTVNTTGAQLYTGATSIGGNLTSTGGAIAVTGAATLANTPIAVVSGGGNILFSSSVDGATALTLNAGAGSTTIGGAAGGSTALASLTATGSTIAVNSVRTTGAQSYTGLTTLNGDLTSTTSGAIAVSGNAIIGAPLVTIATNGGLNTDDITFSGTIEGTGGLDMNAGLADVALTGDAGGTTALSSMNARGATVRVRAVTTTGAQTYTANSGVTLQGNLAATGAGSAISVVGPTTLQGSNISVSSGTAGTATNANDITFSSTIDGASALSISTADNAGDILISGSAGAVTPLTSLLASGATINLQAVTTTGRQGYTGSTRLNGNLRSTQGGDMFILGTTNLAAANITIQSAGAAASDDITLNGDVNGATALTLQAGAGDITVLGNGGANTALTSISATANTITMESMRATGNHLYTANVIALRGDLTGAALTATDSNIGDSNLPLILLGDDTTARTMSMSGGASFRGRVGLVGDQTISGGSGTVFFGSSLQTHQTDANSPERANRSLTILVDNPGALNSTLAIAANGTVSGSVSNTVPVMFNGNVGGDYQGGVAPTAAELAVMLKDLSIGGNLSSVPTTATIVMTPGLFNSQGTGAFTIPNNFLVSDTTGAAVTTRILTVDGFSMGQNQKLLSVGNLYIRNHGTGDIVLGDLTSLVNINVINAGTGNIMLRNRTPGTVNSNVFTRQASGQTTNTTAQDAGLDFVASGVILFNKTPGFVSGTNRRASFSNPRVGSRLEGLYVGDTFETATRVTSGGLDPVEFKITTPGFDSTNFQIFFRDLLIATNGATGSKLTGFENTGLAIDFRAEGTVEQGNLASALASALPSTQGTDPATASVSLSADIREQLQRLGLYVKDGDESSTEAISGRALYKDIPPYASPRLEDYQVSAERLSPKAVGTVLKAYDTLAGSDLGAREERYIAIKDKVRESLGRYVDTLPQGVELDPLEFRRYCEATPAESETVTLLNQVRDVLKALDGLALSPVELRLPKQRLLNDVKPDELTVEQMEQAVTGALPTRSSAPGRARTGGTV